MSNLAPTGTAIKLHELNIFSNPWILQTPSKYSGGRYYPAASMYTLPDQPNCVVEFNFGPDFEVFPEDFDGRPIPKPMLEVPYHGYDGIVERYMQTGLTAEKEH
ncbi:hypothetical protein MRB53_020941 [Persea americana]|uniref:Uncharacterized protein n=1 Tax=Persea americana TaxID=3435 RepID=A0ACC2L2F5_PERAE|nr:hypothetical protein MRB53_020941 [Persea americana]